jgi:2-dehydropantoate 2-reductase
MLGKVPKELRIAILGPGGLGGFLAAVLANHGLKVTCIASETTAEAINARGLRLESPQFGDLTVRPNALTKLEQPVDLLFITTKANGLDSALRRVSCVDLGKTIVVPLLNGIEHVAFLRNSLKAIVIPGSMRISSRIVQPGHIIQYSNFSIINIASDRCRESDKIKQVADVLRYCGVDCQVHTSEAQVLWGKLVRLNALACTTTLTDKPIGWIRADPGWRKTLESIVIEGAKVAGADGLGIDPDEEMAMIDTLPESLTSSMRDDTYAGRPSELDAIAGAVVRIGRKYGINCPVTEDVISKILSKRPMVQHLS